MKKIRTAILGAGGMGTLHSKNLSAIEGVEICAVCDIVLSAAEKLAAQLNAKPYASLEKMLAETELDVVYICIPPYGHGGEFELIASRKIHIFIEKPINLRFEKAQKMVDAAKENKIYSQVGYQMRFGAAVKELKKRLDDGSAGKPVLFTGTYECNSLHSAWWRDKTKCGSQILEQVIHIYDLAVYLFGKPEKVAAYMANICHTQYEDYTVEDVSASIINFKNGAIGSISASNCAIPMKWENPFGVVCENLTVKFANPNEAVFIETANGKASEATVIRSPANISIEEDRYFIDTVRGEKENITTIIDGYNSLQLVDAAARSAQAGGIQIKID
jgi:predicted dehydrogenase